MYDESSDEQGKALIISGTNCFGDELVGWLVYHCANRTIERLKHIYSMKKESVEIIDALTLFILIRCC